jgi:hypothetical protein
VTILAYVQVLFVPLTFVQAILVWQWPSLETFMWILAIGIVTTASQLSLTQALKEAERRVVMPLFFF